MEKEKFNLKTYISDLIHRVNLYKKEQCFICAVLLCFVISGITLPIIKEKIVPEDLAEEAPLVITQDTEIIQSGVANTEEENKDNTPNQPSSTKPSSGAPGSSNNSSGTSSSGSTGATAGKTWVPPVYETIHHDAVYETRTVEMCVTESCGKFFNTPAEFQAHKATEGGCGLYHQVSRRRTVQVLVKEAWDEEVLVSEGYWK